MSLLRIPNNQLDKMQRSPSKQSVLQYLRGLSSHRQSANDGDNKEEDFYSEEFRLLLSIFNISYYTLVTPFRIARAKDGLYKIQTSVLQQICVAILNLLAVTILIREELNDFKGNLIEKPEQLFDIAKAISRILAFLIGIYMFWTKKSKLKKLLKISQNGGNKEKMSRILITCVTIIFLVMWLTDAGINVSHNWPQEIEDHASEIYNLLNYGSPPQSNSSMLNPNSTSSSSFTFQSKLLGSLYYGFKQYSYYIEEFCELALLTIAFTVYRTSSGFHRLLKSNSQDLTKINLHYRYARKVMDLINEFVGPFITVYFFGFMCYLLITCVKLFKTESDKSPSFAQYFYYAYLLKNLAILVIAAEANQKMHFLKEWLFQFKMEEIHDRRNRTRAVGLEMDNVKEESYKILSLEASTTQVGLGGHHFTITHGFIVMQFSIFATYTIIQLGFHKQN